MKSIIFTLTVLLTQSFAAEVDHFMGVNALISDSGHIFNHMVNKQANEALEKLDSNEKSCLKAQGAIIKELKSGIGYKVNKFIRKELPSAYKFPHDLSKYELSKKSIFKNILFLRIAPVIEEIINFNGIYFGIDKLSHFFAMGQIYFNKYNKLKNKDLSESEILDKLFKSGHLSEKTYLGLWGTHIYSYADLEANYQGFLFFKSFCSGNDQILIHDGKRWKLKKSININHYVNPYWNELFNPSFYSKSGRKNLIKNARKYCKDIRYNRNFHFRYRYYNSNLWKKSESQKYFEDKILNGKSPDNSPFKISNICSY